MPAPGAPRTFEDKNMFLVEIDGITHARFATCSSLEPEVEEVIYREGGDLAPTAKDPGLYNVPDVTLTRGAVHDDSDLYDWFESVVSFATDAGALNPNYKRNVDIVILDRDKSELYRWRLFDCWPKKFVAGDWDGNVTEKTITQIVLSVRGVRKITSP